MERLVLRSVSPFAFLTFQDNSPGCCREVPTIDSQRSSKEQKRKYTRIVVRGTTRTMELREDGRIERSRDVKVQVREHQ